MFRHSSVYKQTLDAPACKSASTIIISTNNRKWLLSLDGSGAIVHSLVAESKLRLGFNGLLKIKGCFEWTQAVSRQTSKYVFLSGCLMSPSSVFGQPVFECVLCHVLLCVPLGVAWSPYTGCFAQQSDPDCQGLSVRCYRRRAAQSDCCAVRTPTNHCFFSPNLVKDSAQDTARPINHGQSSVAPTRLSLESLGECCVPGLLLKTKVAFCNPVSIRLPRQGLACVH